MEFLAGGGQFVAFAVHPETHRPYTWGGATPTSTRVEDLPVVTKAQLDELARRLAARWGSEPKQVAVGYVAGPTRNRCRLARRRPPTRCLPSSLRRGMVKSGANHVGYFFVIARRARLHTDGDPRAGYWPGNAGASIASTPIASDLRAAV